MQVQKTDLEGVLLISPPTNFEDFRGSFVELYNEELFTEAGIDVRFVQDDFSTSRRHVLRGLHGDQETWKLVSCLLGQVYCVVVNCDEEASSFGKWQSFVLSDRNRYQLLVPPKFGNGHLVMSEWAIFHYKQSTYYNRDRQFTYAYDDERFGIWWPVRDVIVSRRDDPGRISGSK